MELDTITVMYSGIAAGGPEVLPGSLVQVPPQVEVSAELAKPLKLEGAEPPLSEFKFDHCAPQKVTWVPTAALLSPITKLKLGAVIVKVADPELPV